MILNLLLFWPIVIEDTVRPVATFQLVSEGGDQPDRAVKQKQDWNSVKCWKCSNHGHLSKGCLTMRRPRNPSTFVNSLKNRIWRKNKQETQIQCHQSWEYVSLGATSLPWAAGAFGWRSRVAASSASDLVGEVYSIKTSCEELFNWYQPDITKSQRMTLCIETI